MNKLPAYSKAKAGSAEFPCSCTVDLSKGDKEFFYLIFLHPYTGICYGNFNILRVFPQCAAGLSVILIIFYRVWDKVIENNLIDSDLNVDEIGKSLGLSRVQLYRKIKSLTNYAPNELVRIIRLKAAEQLFIHSDKTISEVAYETGFTSPSYFSKCFKEYFNENPTEYISRLKK